MKIREEELPRCTTEHGLVLEDPNLILQENTLINTEEALPIETINPPEGADKRKWSAYTDGACSNNQIPKLRRAGYGVWFGYKYNHPNFKKKTLNTYTRW